MTRLFNVTYERITDASAEIGDAEERGFIAEDVSVREALSYASQTVSAEVTAAEPDDSNVSAARWITFYGGRDMHSGDFVNASIHFPEHITGASRARLVRLLVK
jgi:hypothetical protein